MFLKVLLAKIDSSYFSRTLSLLRKYSHAWPEAILAYRTDVCILELVYRIFETGYDDKIFLIESVFLK